MYSYIVRYCSYAMSDYFSEVYKYTLTGHHLPPHLDDVAMVMPSRTTQPLRTAAYASSTAGPSVQAAVDNGPFGARDIRYQRVAHMLPCYRCYI